VAEIVNLRLARKARARATKEADAAANRAAFGRSKAEKSVAKIDAARAARLLDGAKRDDDC
jgi:hypothetical protein